MTRVALYARYSHDSQNERSIADQLGVLIAHAGRKDWSVVATFTDAAISGSAMANRPGLLNAIAAAERGDFDLLLVEDEDRLARNLEHMAHIANRLADVGAGIATLTTDHVQDMQVAFKGLIAQDFLRNLAQKTRRGMASNAAKGLATGGRLYGYRTQPGGAVEIVPEQAEVIRRVFHYYADDGLMARQIAARLNAEGVPGPRGGLWSASTISGSRQRANGILHSEVYAGVKVYGRVEKRRDRRTGQRLTICKPADQHTRVDVPHLAIIDRELWARTEARRSSQTLGDPASRKKPAKRPFLLSGLTFCGECGASYTAQGMNRLACAAYREKGATACTNRRHVNRRDVEARVLTGLRERLLSPEAVAAYVQSYHLAWAAAAEARRSERGPAEKRLAELKRGIARAVDAIVSGMAGSDALAQRLAEMEAEAAGLTQHLAQLDEQAPLPVQLHPKAGDAYVARVEKLEAILIENDGQPQSTADQALMNAVRDLIERIEIQPESNETRAPYRVTLHGALARLLSPDAPVHVGERLVTGGGIEPPTCGL